jgi:hypothetical protein
MSVRLAKNYAESIDGVDPANCAVGEIPDLPADEARLLLAEMWAIPDRRCEIHSFAPTPAAARIIREPEEGASAS